LPAYILLKLTNEFPNYKNIKMKRLLYIMQVPWGWIKQRPHFLAEGLTSHYKVRVYYDKPDKNASNQHVNNVTNLALHTFPKLQVTVGKFHKLVGLINYYLKKATCLWQVYTNDTIWITFPNQYAHIRHFLPKNKTVIYDNMDDALAFYNYNQQLTGLEKELCKRANIIFCSSISLKEKLIERHHTKEEKITIINNAINLPKTVEKKDLPESVLKLFSKDKKNLVYIGTIASWLDFNLLIKSVNHVTNLNIILIGPLEENLRIPDHPNLKVHAPIEHKLVFPVMEKADALVMPFVVNDIILSVNPVKAYEYIYSEKPVILVDYPESRKFEDFVYLYSNFEEFENHCTRLTQANLPPLASISSSKKFVSQNTWEKRSIEIMKILQ